MGRRKVCPWYRVIFRILVIFLTIAIRMLLQVS